MSFKVIPSDNYVPSGYSTREQLDRGCLCEGQQNYIKNKNEANGINLILGDFHCTIDKIDRYGRNKTQRLHRCSSNYALSKFIVDNGLEDLWGKENPHFPDFSRYDGSILT